jgi:phospholipase C
VIAYDDSDGWYDHQLGPLVNQSASAADAISGTGSCGNPKTALPGIASGTVNAQGRCGYGPRLPLMLISPWAKSNFVDHSVTDQTSVLRFIEDNWLNGQRLGAGSFDVLANSLGGMLDFTMMGNAGAYQLDPGSGLVVSQTSTPSASAPSTPFRIKHFALP